jgi:hypothetical protein
VSTKTLGLARLNRAGQTCKSVNQIIVALNVDVKKSDGSNTVTFLLYASLRPEDLTART